MSTPVKTEIDIDENKETRVASELMNVDYGYYHAYQKLWTSAYQINLIKM